MYGRKFWECELISRTIMLEPQDMVKIIFLGDIHANHLMKYKWDMMG